MRLAPLIILGVVGLIGAPAACSSPASYQEKPDGSTPHQDEDASAQPDVIWSTEGGGEPGCRNLECKKVKCDNGSTTNISGVIYAPNGTLPLYNVIAYIPNDPLKDIPEGAQCDRCGAVASGNPINTAISDATGHFELTDVPAGDDIPLVIQVGKWRRTTTIHVEPCTENVLTDPELTRLPKNRTEGNMPRIAVTSGECDRLACVLPKIGIDAAEFGVEGSDTLVHMYQGSSGGGPAGMTPAKNLWDSKDTLAKYDMAILSCECDEGPSSKNTVSYQAMTDYLAAGGRIFTTDFQYTWYKYSPDPDLAGAANIRGGASPGTPPITLDTTFPKGQALADWLQFLAPDQPYGQISPTFVYTNLVSVPDPSKAQVWGSAANGEPRIMTINTPVGQDVENQCGKAVYLDGHLNNPSDSVGTGFPTTGCSNPLSPGEKALAFFLFDLSSCIQKEDAAPAPPIH